MMNRIFLIFVVFLLLMLNGCSWIGVGKNDTYCGEHNCDYSDAGVCGNSYDVYKNWQETQKKAYQDYTCKKGSNDE